MSLQLPPSANWYSSAACDWSGAPGGLVAFTAKNTVRLLDPLTRELRGALIGHSDRVVSVEFCRMAGTLHLCATASVDLSVRVWDANSTACLHKLAGGAGGGHAKEVVAASMSAAAAGVVVSADKTGQVIAWNYLTGAVSKSKPLNTSATCVRCAGPGRAEAAVAYQNGVVVVVDLTAQPLRRYGWQRGVPCSLLCESIRISKCC
ncbi:WD40-repeat-containing domain protein [Baffinella frigidus]|nr:WD40-repeat-containing domain protein [Cryptophyta sp. CCMP2293]